MKKIMFMIFSMMFFNNCSSSQEDSSKKEQQLINRKPYVAGSFYPSDKSELESTLKKLFDKAISSKQKDVRAIISPHAGYVYSGEVAATAFKAIDKDKNFENVFVITTSHRMWFDGAALYDIGNFETPLGTIKVNIPLCKELIKKSSVFQSNPNAHNGEHSLEVQLPFLQYHLKNDFMLVPIVIGTSNPETCKKIANELKPYFNEKNLFVISTDFSHYPPYEVAVKTDKATVEAVLTQDPQVFISRLNSIESKGEKNLSTAMCGWTSVLTLLYITENQKQYKYVHLQYKNSGDVDFGDKSRVVGYHAIAVVNDENQEKTDNIEISLTNSEKEVLLKLARKTISDYLKKNKTESLKDSDFSENLKKKYGLFVTLHKNGNLRGCIGRFSSDEPIYKTVQQMAIAAAFQDYRFSPVTEDELKDIDIEISILSPMKKIKSIDEIVLGKHGIYIVKDGRSGTFLPQVATETGWTKEEFLGHCARDKAGIGWNGWKDADIYIYTAYIFSEKELNLKH